MITRYLSRLLSNPRWPEERPPAFLDRESRTAKAEKIIALLAARIRLEGARSLEVGCGAGYLAAMRAKKAGPDGYTVGVDVEDCRQVTDGFDFALVSDTKLPFPAASFDLVVSSHVIEHVGERSAQRDHMNEVQRVLARDGVFLLALPNSRFPFERHFRLLFVTQLPRRLRAPYIRLMGRETRYSVDIPSPIAVRRMAADAGFEITEVTSDAMREFRRIERPRGVLAQLFNLPDPLFRWAMFVAPSKTYLLRPRRD